MNSTTDTLSLKDKFVTPLNDALCRSGYTRKCPSFSDEDWLLAGVQRSLDTFSSGRDFLQKFGRLSDGISTYFDSLKSNRRRKLVEDVAFRVAKDIECKATDLLGEHLPQLDGYDIWAGDGHWHEHATHEKKRGGKYYATGHLYGLNLRTDILHHLITLDQQTKRKEHDMSGLKRLSPDELRVQAPKGRKVVWIWDKAGINFRKWFHWKDQNGIYFISLEKENMKLDDIAIPLTFDKTSKINAGVIADELCATSQGIYVRRVTYCDPATGEIFKFITSLTSRSIEPGVIAQLYRMRWDIEKTFDDVKNKFKEQKAWATSETAKSIQAELICLTYNLTRNLERIMEADHGVRNVAEDKRRADRLAKLKAEVTKEGKHLPLLYETLVRSTQISVKFIRWIRYHVWNETSDTFAIKELAAIYSKL